MDMPMPPMSPSYRVPPRRREEMDPATKRLVAFAGVIGAALLVLVGVWSFGGHRHAAVPVIEADSRPLREKPANPGGLQVDGASDALLAGDTGGKQTVAPPPETPAPQALQAQEQAAAAARTPAPQAPAAAAAPQPAPAPMAANIPPAAAQTTTVRPEVQPLPPLPPHIATAPAAKPAAPAVVAAAPAAAPKAAPAAAPATHSLLAVAQPAPVAPLAKPHGQAAPATVPAAATPAPAPAIGGALVQLAALKTEADAQAEWQRLAHKYPDLLGGRRPVISKTEHGGNTYWRLRTGGFADAGQAGAFCDQVKAKGAGCTVAHL